MRLVAARGTIPSGGCEHEVAQAIVALGSNMGDRLANMQEALSILENHSQVLARSAVYETEPMYVSDQPPFYNAAVSIEVGLGPLGLLRLLKRIETMVGRKRRRRFGPREIDLDLITFGGLRYRFSDSTKTILELPHPRMSERRFVIQPVHDLGIMDVPGLEPLPILLCQTQDQAAAVRIIADAELSLHSH